MNPNTMADEDLRRIVREAVGNIVNREFKQSYTSSQDGDLGVFADMNDAVEAAHKAFLEFQECDLQDRKKIIDAVRQLTMEYKEDFSRMAVEQTGMGRVDHKILKHVNTAEHTPGVDYLKPEASSGKNGMAFDEYAPWGVIGNITPSTHPSCAMLNNIIMQVAAGNTIAFNPHPVAKKLNAYVIKKCNEYMTAAGAPKNMVTCVADPTLESAEILFGHKKTHLLSITGGPGVVAAALKHGKPTIAAGAGNPPVLIDETADLALAAKEITDSSAFDNNILCIAEKEIFVVESVFQKFMQEFERYGNYKLTSFQMDTMAKKALSLNGKHYLIGRDYVGKSATVLGKAIGLNVKENVPFLFGETTSDHPWVVAEQMTCILPIIKVRDFNDGLTKCLRAEHGFGHTSSVFTQDMKRASLFSQKMNTTVVVVNGGTLRGNGGNGGESFFSHTIASPTGQGITTPRDFSRKRRIMTNNMRFI